VAFGHLVNVGLKLFSLMTGWSGNVRKGAYEQVRLAVTATESSVVLPCSLLKPLFLLSFYLP
jgi:hypothetical protein